MYRKYTYIVSLNLVDEKCVLWEICVPDFTAAIFHMAICKEALHQLSELLCRGSACELNTK